MTKPDGGAANAAGAIADAIERHVREIGYVDDDDAEFGRDVHLFQSGYLDSLGVESLVVFIEEQFDIELDEDMLTDPRFVDIDGISAIVADRLSRTPVR